MFRVRIDPLANQGVGLAFTDRHGGVSSGRMGSLNLGRTLDDRVADVETNFERVRRSIGVSKVIATSQTHGTDVLLVDEELMGRWGPRSHLGSPGGQAPLPEADAMVTRLTDVALCIRIADCVPVLLADVEAGVIGAAHAGRVGFLDGILPETVTAMRDLGAGQITAWVGPHVCGTCYEVPAEMAAEVEKTHPEIITSTERGTPALDLGLGAELQLVALGVEPVRLDPCTMTEPDLHSHRRDGASAGRLGALIWRVSGQA